MDYSTHSPLTHPAAFHSSSSSLSITQGGAGKEVDKRGGGFNLWKGIKPSVAMLWVGGRAKVVGLTTELSKSAAVCAGFPVGLGKTEGVKYICSTLRSN